MFSVYSIFYGNQNNLNYSCGENLWFSLIFPPDFAPKGLCPSLPTPISVSAGAKKLPVFHVVGDKESFMLNLAHAIL